MSLTAHLVAVAVRKWRYIFVGNGGEIIAFLSSLQLNISVFAYKST
jgi:hypothetical protein